MTDTPRSPWRTPLLLAAIGLLLMVGGYHLMSYQSLLPPRTDQQRQLEQLRRQAEAQGETDPQTKILADRLRTMSEGSRFYRILGRLGIYVGLLLFGAAFFVMYRSRPQPEAAQEAEAAEEDLPWRPPQAGE